VALAIVCVGLFIWALWIYADRNLVGMAIILAPVGAVVLAINYPTAFGIGLMSLIALGLMFVLVFDWGPKGWRLFMPWLDWIWRHPMDNSTGPPLEPQPPLTYTDDELRRVMDATVEAHRAKQRQ
jgi:hypothetical protein